MESTPMPLQERPVGVFDSGLGGLSVLREIRAQLPGEHVVYFGDTAHAPYGTKPPEEVMARVRQVMAELARHGAKAVVIACNTATSVAAATLRAESSLPIIGMEPALKPAAELRHGGQVLVMATPLTLRLPKFAALMARYGAGAIPLPCPGLMELVEQGELDTPAVEDYLTHLLAPYQSAPLDAVVLGCTHYVFLRPVLRRLLPPSVALLDGNAGAVRQLRRVLDARGLRRPTETGGQVQLLTSGDPATVLPQMEALLRLPLTADGCGAAPQQTETSK